MISIILWLSLAYIAFCLRKKRPVPVKVLFGLWVLTQMGKAVFESASDYFLWQDGGLSRILLDLPLTETGPLFSFLQPFLSGPLGYFIFYVFTRYWLAILVSLVAALTVYGLLIILKRYRERFFDEGEVELGFLLSCMVGWPGIVLFLLLAAVLVVIFSLVRTFAKSEMYTTVTWPFLVSAFLCLLVQQTAIYQASFQVLML